jgi:O-antigen/teichoic acid export membrane protein
VTLSGLVASVVAGIALIPKWGYYGAAWSRFIAEVVMVSVSAVMNRLCFPTPYQYGRIGEYIAVALALFYLAEVVEVGNIVARYGLNAAIFGAYILYVVRREKIDVVALVKAILRR